MITLSLASLKKTSLARPAGYLDDVLSRAKIDGDRVSIEDADYQELVGKYRNRKRPPNDPARVPKGDPPAPTSGPGTELKGLLKDWLGIQASPNCSCNARARQMDEWGPDLCEQNLQTIVGWLEEQAKARKLPFVRFAAEQAVKLAIRRARKKAAR